MTLQKPLRVFTSLVLAFAHVSALADDGAPPPPENVNASFDADASETVDHPNNPHTLPHTFRQIIPTVLESHVDGNAGALMLNFESAQVDQLGEMIEMARRKGLTPDWRKIPPTIILYVTQDAYDHNRDQLVTDTIRSFHEVYPDVDPTVEVRVDQTNVWVRAAYKTIRAGLTEDRDHHPDPEIRREITEQIQILDLSYQDVKSRFVFTAKRSRELKGRVAKVRASIVWATRLATVYPAMTLGLGPATLALTMATADAGLELFTATWSQRMQQFLSRNPFALSERTFFRGTRFEIRAERINSIVSVGINTTWNIALFVVARATILTSLQTAAVPAWYSWPTAAMLAVNVVYSLPTAALNAYFVKGYLSLVNKGRVSSAQMDMFLQGNFIPDTANSFGNSIKKLGWLRNVATPLLVLAFLGVGFAGDKLQRRTDRIVLIHDAINLDHKGADPRMEQANIAATMNIANDNRERNFGKVWSDIQTLREQRGDCEPLLTGEGPSTPPPEPTPPSAPPLDQAA